MSKGSRLGKYVRIPFRVFSRARDLYVRRMTGWAGRMNYYPAMGGGAMAVSYPAMGMGLPRNFSYGSNSSDNDDDIRELIRVASVSHKRASAERRMSKSVDAVARSQSVVAGRIDEDEACEFADDVRVGVSLMYPRSRSCAVAGKSRIGRMHA